MFGNNLERRQRSHVPVVFWYFSIGGGLMLLTYAIQRRDPVFILGRSPAVPLQARIFCRILRPQGWRPAGGEFAAAGRNATV